MSVDDIIFLRTVSVHIQFGYNKLLQYEADCRRRLYTVMFTLQQVIFFKTKYKFPTVCLKNVRYILLEFLLKIKTPCVILVITHSFSKS